MLSKKTKIWPSVRSNNNQRAKRRFWMNDVWPVQFDDNLCPLTKWGDRYATFIDYKKDCTFDYSHYSNDVKDIVSKTPVIQIDKPIDIVSLLSFNGENNYLSRNNNAEHNHVVLDYDTFRGKYVMVVCVLLPLHRLHEDAPVFQDLSDLCFEIFECFDNVEIVLVPKLLCAINQDWVVKHFLSAFPKRCLVVPFQDTRRCDYLCCYLDMSLWCNCTCLIVDPNSIAVLRGYPNFVSEFGADSFPFTPPVICARTADESPRWKTPSTTQLEKLLGCTASDVLYKVNQDDWAEEDKEKVSISELNKKVVGLFYWCEGTCCIDENSLVHTLHNAYNHCRAKQWEFEIVVLYMPFLDCLPSKKYSDKLDLFMKDLNISWWKMPFNNSKCRRLWRICRYGGDKLIIVGPRNEFVDCDGGEILGYLGADAYPFTKEGLVLNQIKSFRDLTLESLLVSQSYNYVVKHGTRKLVADIQPLNVLLYFGDFDDAWILDDLDKWYDEIKSIHPNFEVIYVRQSTVMDSREDYNGGVAALLSEHPWLVERPFEPEHSKSVEAKLFPLFYPFDTLVLFGSDGHVCSIDIQNDLHARGPLDFPFDCDLRKDVIKRFRTRYLFLDDYE